MTTLKSLYIILATLILSAAAFADTGPQDPQRKSCGRHCGWGAGTQNPDPLKVDRCKAHPGACK